MNLSPNQNPLTNVFDALNRPVKRTWPDSVSEGFGYSAAGLTAYTNRDQKVTRYGRDGAGRLTSVTNANMEVTQFGYDSLNNLTSLIDGLLHQTTWQYNEYGWLTNKVDGLGRNAFRYACNANGWVTNRWTPEKGSTGYAYDNVGNLKSINYPLSTINYSYDLLNRLTTIQDAIGTTTRRYTATGQLLSEGGLWANDTVSYSYVQGLRTLMTISQPGTNWSQSYGYDSGWRLNSITSSAGTFGYSYNFQPASSLVTGISLPNGAKIANGYDSLARLTGTALNNYWGHTLDGYTYNYDSLGLRTNIMRNFGMTTNSVSVGYDNIEQITSWMAKESGGMLRQNEQLGFGYDAAHNLHTRNNGNLAQTFTTDAANQLNSVTRLGNFTLTGATPAPAASVTVNGLAAQTYSDFTFALTNLSLVDGMNTFTIIATNIYGVRATNILTLNLPASVPISYDSNGNLTNDGSRSLAYDSENQLTNATVANQLRKDFVYDGLNRLRIRREFCWTNNAWLLTNETHFVCDGYNIIQHRDANNAPTLTLTRGLDLSGSLRGAGGIGGLLAMTDGSGASYYYHQDGSGNVTTLVDVMENIIARREYDAFLRTINLTGPKSGLNQYWGSGWLLDDPDLLHAPRRTYTSNPPRWTSNDPIQEWGGINQPSFVGNNPLRYVDPLGLAGNPIMGLGGASNSDPYGQGGSFYGPGYLYTPRSGNYTPDGPGYYDLSSLPYYNPSMPSDFYSSGVLTDDDIFGLLFPFLTPEAGAADLFKSDCPVTKGAPKRSPNARPPTNPPQLPPSSIPSGYRIRTSPPTSAYPEYPYGKWQLEKPMADGSWQPVNPVTGRPGPAWDTHVPLPPPN